MSPKSGEAESLPENIRLAIRRQSLHRFFAYQVGLANRVDESAALVRDTLAGYGPSSIQDRPLVDGILKEHALVDGRGLLPLGRALREALNRVQCRRLWNVNQQGRDSERIVSWASGRRWAALGVDHVRTAKPEPGRRVKALMFGGKVEAQVRDAESMYIASFNAMVRPRTIPLWKMAGSGPPTADAPTK